MSKTTGQIDYHRMYNESQKEVQRLEEINRRYKELNLSNIESSYKNGFSLAACILNPSLSDDEIQKMRDMAWENYFKSLEKVESES